MLIIANLECKPALLSTFFLHLFFNCSSSYRLRLRLVRELNGRKDIFSVICLSQIISTSLSMGTHVRHMFKGQYLTALLIQHSSNDFSAIVYRFGN